MVEDDDDPRGRCQRAVCVEAGEMVPTAGLLTLAKILALGNGLGLPVD
jgi:hypothetical protein